MAQYKELENILYNYPSLKIEVKNLYIDLEEVTEVIRVYGESGAPDTGGPAYIFNSAVENEFIGREGSLKDKAEHIIRLIRSKERRIQKIENAISLLDAESIEFIKLRYWENIKIEHIASQYNLAKTALYKRKDKILEELSLYLMPAIAL